MFHTINLAQHRAIHQHDLPRRPFPHQKEAFTCMSRLFTFPSDRHRSGMLVLPTGGGKTFTAVNWICRNVLSAGVRVLWLAHTSHLLEQAMEELLRNIHEVNKRETLRLRLVSGNPMHSPVSSIDTDDDVLIITTQSAISNWETDARDNAGRKRRTAFEAFIARAGSDGLFVVIDEAHHAPAFGCRNLLIGGAVNGRGIRQVVPTVSFLGLTATPTYNDERRRGWLHEIFATEMFERKGIIYEADKASLTRQNILAVPLYIQRKTGREFTVSDKVYDQIMKMHTDLPEDVVDRLANDAPRNDMIVHDFLQNRSTYGKTLIFVDRWHQCVYMKEKLVKHGVKADAVYSHVDSRGATVAERNVRQASDNARILQRFRSGELDVLINVKMLTEGTDVPEVRTVMITRETKSPILMTQMIGRALRGKRAGAGDDKDCARIVFFTDSWDRALHFATPSGNTMEDVPVRGNYPTQFISIHLVEQLSRMIDGGLVFPNETYLDSIPVGWFETELLVSNDEGMDAYKEFVIVHGRSLPRWNAFISHLLSNPPVQWEDEALDVGRSLPEVKRWINRHFTLDEDNAFHTLDYDVIRIARHIAQSGTAPEYFSFEDRDKHDLSAIALEAVQKRLDDFTMEDMLIQEYNAPDKCWSLFYTDYARFATAFDAERRRALFILRNNGSTPSRVTVAPAVPDFKRELTEQDKKQVFNRDNNACLCCGATPSRGRRISLQVDHILPVKFGGQTTLDNSQTLCNVCNNIKDVQEVNFRFNKTSLPAPGSLNTFKIANTRWIDEILRRIVNFFYRCHAVYSIEWDLRPRSKHGKRWIVTLYQGNDPAWIRVHETAIVEYFHNDIGYRALQHIDFF